MTVSASKWKKADYNLKLFSPLKMSKRMSENCLGTEMRIFQLQRLWERIIFSEVALNPVSF